MYFLTKEEREKLIKGILPKSRRMYVSDELRGWNWNRPPLENIYNQSLTLFEVTNRYCETGRDLFMKKVEMIKVEPSYKMQEEMLFNKILNHLIKNTKRAIYVHEIKNIDKAMAEISSVNIDYVNSLVETYDESLKPELEEKIQTLWDFESNRINFRLQDTLAKHPDIEEDSLLAQAIPVTVEHRLDGSFIGLNNYLSVDAFSFIESILFEVKYEEPKLFHRLKVTGHALAMEALTSLPVNIGCIVYPKFKNGRLTVSKEFHMIDDELRQWFIEERDHKMRMIYEEIDPGKSQNCPKDCPYMDVC
ncbi:MAG: type I-A CRISPR-associated protein Cas4/Csa1 [Halanaerobiales bacterium]|nr:type I-A CRISPR-associated protein Cas4/Csa1 [Halanaerobiales bacterium]